MKINHKILDQRITPEMLKPSTPGSAGIDLRACIGEPIRIRPGESVLVPSGISIHIADHGYAAFIFPRSGLGHKHGLVLGNLTGVIDSDYQGEIMISAWNRGTSCYTVKPMDRIAQLVVMPVAHPEFRLVESFEQSERGEGGFGSTDKACIVDMQELVADFQKVLDDNLDNLIEESSRIKLKAQQIRDDIESVVRSKGEKFRP